VGRLKGLCAVKGGPIPWVAQAEGGREPVDWNNRRRISLLWVVLNCEWTIERRPFIVDL